MKIEKKKFLNILSLINGVIKGQQFDFSMKNSMFFKRYIVFFLYQMYNDIVKLIKLYILCYI